MVPGIQECHQSRAPLPLSTFLPESPFGSPRLERSQVLSSTTAVPPSADTPLCSGASITGSGNPGTATPVSTIPGDSENSADRPAWLSLPSLVQGRAPGQPHKLPCASKLVVKLHNILLEATPDRCSRQPFSKGLSESLPNCPRRGWDLCDIRGAAPRFPRLLAPPVFPETQAGQQPATRRLARLHRDGS